MSSIIPGPVPAYANLPIEAENYQPRRFVISDLTFHGPTTTVTTSTAHDYVIGQEIRLLIPSFYGSYQLNERLGFVSAVPSSTEVMVNISSYEVNPFISSPAYGPTSAQIVAVGDVNSGPLNPDGRTNQQTYINGSFINISPL